MVTRKPPLRVCQSVLHLAVLGTLGWAVLGTLIGFIGAGIGLTAVFGIGLVLLVGAVYALFGLGWFETARVNGLYRLEVPLPVLRQPQTPGFGGWLRSLGRQLGDGPMWRALAGFALACALGALLVPLARAIVVGVRLLFAPIGAADTVRVYGFDVPALTGPVWGAVLIVLALAAALALALLHRTLSIAIIASRAREDELTAEARQSAEQRQGAVRAADVERTRIERDLHDGVQPRLVSVGMTLGLAQQKIDEDPETAKALIAEAHTSTKAAITELRQLARGIHASVLDDRGLDAALSALAGRSHIPVHLDVRLPERGTGRCSREAEAAVYFCVAESLTNAAKHSRASSCRVTVRMREEQAGPVLWARIEDDGIGGASVVPGGGLDGLSNRVLAARGTIRIDSPQGGPTALEVSVPCAS